MNRKWYHHLNLATGLIMAGSLVGCLGGTAPPPTTPPAMQAAYTAAAETIIAELTRHAPTSTLPSSATPLPSTETSMPATPVAITETPTLTPTLQPTATLEPSPTIPATPTSVALFQDDFSSKAGWVVEKNDRWELGFTDGVYRIHVKIIQAPIWSARSLKYEDVRLEVEATKSAGPADGYYGLVCRHLDGGNYYALVVSPNGDAGIFKKQDGQRTVLQEGALPSSVILPVNATNRVRADCVGNILTLYVNGQKLLEVQDTAFSAGGVGLIAGTRAEKGLEVLFDNFLILEP